MILKLVDIKAPVLRQKAKLVKSIDKKIKVLIEDMKETLSAQNDPEGVGLAAPQVGKSLQIFVIDHNKTKEVVINPKVINISESKFSKKEANNLLEGCLSLPHYYGPLKRANEITIEYRNEEFKTQTKTYKKFLAQIIQHEIDHLEGTLFIDRILEQNAPLYKFTGSDEWEEVELV